MSDKKEPTREDIAKEAATAEDIIDLEGLDFSLPKADSTLIRMANELYGWLMEAHMARLNAAANRAASNEAEQKKWEQKQTVAKAMAAQIMREHPGVRARMEKLLKEADRANKEREK